jgi:hypothetical protein
VPWKHADLSMRLPGSYRTAQIPIGGRGTVRAKKEPPRGVVQGPRTRFFVSAKPGGGRGENLPSGERTSPKEEYHAATLRAAAASG